NDAHGHRGGDAVLKALADVLTRTFPRKSDLVARFGGEEFAVILRDASGVDALRLGERLPSQVRALAVVHEGKEIRVTVSIGAATVIAAQPVKWFEAADKALYRAKADGRNRCETADQNE